MPDISLLRDTTTEKDFLDIYDQYADMVFRYCWRRVYDRELAKDIMQEAFMKSWQYVSEGKSVQNMKAFVFQVATNLIIDYHKKKKDLSLETIEEHSPAITVNNKKNWDAMIDAKDMLKHVEQLEEPYKTAFELRYLQELTPKEIAQIVGERVNVISVRIHRARKQFLSMVKP
ncbi:MAG: RNA polymerase sigma factor [Candidatus Magasanikbacteria bacterium]|uniref:RNA polymerase sigma factor n=1 Tax=Candidatus Magasanikbacteria bacterium CG10_big_fil_rev_8_21_14_0_10_38_6 TaxID=1974647 RepID=A0A2M6P0R6_9BACT|nr:RNA polymerase sigma factor [Candidatus Magasanikbacteria bacterium]PIR77291.1 MAG: hypothetical protein COU30_03240 [Candidatus Magasanikbacteria bacterium CG10_big_fil_rev_8_21_14_0_10_38_6]